METLIHGDNTWVLFGILVIIAAAAIWLEQHTKLGSTLTGCIMAMLMAMALSNLRVIPMDSAAYDFVGEYIVPLAIPMLLFKANIKKIWKESGRCLAIFLISGLGTVAGAFLGFFLLKSLIPELGKIAAMMTGTYTGGTVNFVSMAEAFGASEDSVSASLVADNVLGTLYMFVLLAIPGLSFFRKHFKHPIMDRLEQNGGKGQNNAANFWTPKPISLFHIAKDFALAFIITASSIMIADWLGSVIPKTNFGLELLNNLFGNKYLIITTLSMILATLLPNQVGDTPGAQELGTFMVHIFFASSGVPASLWLIITKAPLILLFCLIVVAMNLLFSFLGGKLFGFHIEEICIASDANIGGPTTAAAVAIAKGWTEMVAPALLIGTLGYIIGNYYGLFVGTVLK